MSRLRVLWLIKGLGPGGAERLLVSAAGSHDRQAFDIEVAYLLNWKTHLVSELEALDVRVHPLDVTTPLDLRWLFRLNRLLRRERFDVVHVHSPLAAVGARFLLRFFPRYPHTRLVSTEHNLWSSHVPLTRMLNALTAPLDDARLAVSEDTRSGIWRPVRGGVETVVHGVSLEAFRAARAERQRSRASLGFADDEVVIGTVANYRAQKAYPDLLSAARLVVDTGLPVRFLSVGQGPLEAEIKALHAELGLGDRFLLLGYQRDPTTALAACDVFVLSSLYEGYPIAVMEALAMGLPVVATAVGGVREAVREGVEGLIVSPQRPDQLAAAIEALVRDGPGRARMGARAAERAAEFDISRAVRRIEATYHRVCRGV